MEARQELLELILEVSFRKQKVVLASGRDSDFYLDLRQTLMRPRGVALAGSLILDALQGGVSVQSVGGMAVGAVPLVSAVLAAAAVRDPATPLLGFFVRKEAKQHGLGRRIEGGFREGQSVALDAVQDAGGKVVRVLCLVDREEGAMQAFRARGIELEALFTRVDLPV